MQVHLDAEREAKLQAIAAKTGQDLEQIVNEAVDRMYEYDAYLQQKVETGLAQLDRGEGVDDEEVRLWLERRESA